VQFLNVTACGTYIYHGVLKVNTKSKQQFVKINSCYDVQFNIYGVDEFNYKIFPFFFCRLIRLYIFIPGVTQTSPVSPVLLIVLTVTSYVVCNQVVPTLKFKCYVGLLVRLMSVCPSHVRVYSVH
jgi:hypothetical protein